MATITREEIKAKLAEINAELENAEEWGIVYKNNGTLHVNWGHAEHLNGWHLTPEQEAAYDNAKEECYRAEHLIHRRNYLNNLLAG